MGWVAGRGGFVGGRARSRGRRATTTFEVVSGEVSQLAGEHALQTGELPYAETDWDDGIAG